MPLHDWKWLSPVLSELPLGAPSGNADGVVIQYRPSTEMNRTTGTLMLIRLNP